MFNKQPLPTKTTLGTAKSKTSKPSSFRKASKAQLPPTPIAVKKTGKSAPLDPMSIMAAPQRKR